VTRNGAGVGRPAKTKYHRIPFPTGTLMTQPQRGSIVGSIVAILVCGVAGGYAAWTIVSGLGIDGVTGALVAALMGMIAATALWAGGSWLLRTVGWLR